MFISPPGDKPCAIKNVPLFGGAAAPPKALEGQNEKDKYKGGKSFLRRVNLFQQRRHRKAIAIGIPILDVWWQHIYIGSLTFVSTNIWQGVCRESLSSGNENAGLELSSYWVLADLRPSNTPSASLFVTQWMHLESETIREDLLLTSSFSEHLIVDLPRLNLRWNCNRHDLEFTTTHTHKYTLTVTHTKMTWGRGSRWSPMHLKLTFHFVLTQMIENNYFSFLLVLYYSESSCVIHL